MAYTPQSWRDPSTHPFIHPMPREGVMSWISILSAPCSGQTQTPQQAVSYQKHIWKLWFSERAQCTCRLLRNPSRARQSDCAWSEKNRAHLPTCHNERCANEPDQSHPCATKQVARLGSSFPSWIQLLVMLPDIRVMS